MRKKIGKSIVAGVFSVAFLLSAGAVFAASQPVMITGTVNDASGAGVPYAKVYLMITSERTRTVNADKVGNFGFQFEQVNGTCTIFASAPGLTGESTKVACFRDTIGLNLTVSPAAVSETVVVEGRAESTLSTSASSISFLTTEDLRIFQTPRLVDSLRYFSGVQVNQTGRQGGVSGVFVRGADSKYNLVTINGVRVNDFGGAYNFSSLVPESVERLELTRGPQSASFGSYAIGSAIRIETLSGLDRQEVIASAEAGNFGTEKYTVGGGDNIGNFGIYGAYSHINSDGAVANDDSRLDNLHMRGDYIIDGNRRLQYGFMRNVNQAGNPGPYGSDPVGLFTAIDTVTRTNQKTTLHSLSYEEVHYGGRGRMTISAFSDKLDFQSPFGPSFSEQKRLTADSESNFSIGRHDVLVSGFELSRETFRNSFVTDGAFREFPLNRNVFGLFLENHYEYNEKLFLNTGARLEVLQQEGIPADAYGSRPDFPESVIVEVHPKIGMAYLPRSSTRLHASAGTGLRPPDGFELAFTTNPALKPERTVSYDIGVEQKLFGQRLVLGTTWFYNRFRDQIVTLSGDLANLSRWQSDNLANSLSRGLEQSVQVQLTRNLSLRGTYTYLDTKVLNLDGTSATQAFFTPGQQLLRRPRHSGSYLAVWQNSRLVAETGMVMRGRTLDVEPNYGISAGQFTNPFYATFDAGLQVRVKSGLWLSAKATNLTDRSYEESLGFPALGRSLTAGLKWRSGS